MFLAVARHRLTAPGKLPLQRSLPMSDQRALASPYAQSPVAVAEAFVAGRDSRARDPLSICPYPEGTHEHGAWNRGFKVTEILSKL